MLNINLKVIKTVILLIIGMLLLIILWNLNNKRPEDFFDTHEGLRETIYDTLVKRVEEGLLLYKNKNGHYPITNSKYFLDSLDGMINIPLVYLYQDRPIEGSTKSIEFQGGVFVNTFIGIGNCEVIIKYISTDGISYKLYR